MRKLGPILAVVLFVDAALFGALIPLLPELRDDLDLDKTGAGLLFGAFGAGALVAGVPAGLLVQRIGPRRTVVAGLAVLSASSLAFALAGDPVTLGLARFAQGVSSVTTWSGGLAWIAVATPRERRGQALGTAYGIAVFGFVTGPVIGAAARETSIGAVFGAVCGLAAVLAVVMHTCEEPPRESSRPGAVRRALTDPRFLAGLWLSFLPALFFGVLDVLATLDLDDAGWGGFAVAGVFVAAGALEALVNPAAGRVSDRHGRLLPVRAGLAGAVAVAALLAAIDGAWVVAALVLAGAVVFGGLYTPGMTLIADRAERAGLGQGLGFGLSNTVWAAGAAIGPFAGAAIAEAASDAVPYATLAMLAAVTLATVSSRTAARLGR